MKKWIVLVFCCCLSLNIQAKAQGISLDFQDISVRSVLEMLAGFSKTKLVVGAEVQGNMTVKLHDLQFDQALDVILKQQGLMKRVVGGEILINRATTSASHAVVQSKLNLLSVVIQLQYSSAIAFARMLNERSSAWLSPRGSVSVDSRTNRIFLRDTALHCKRIQHLAQQWDIPSPQVMIEAKIVNMSKDCARDLGVRFGLSAPAAVSGLLDHRFNIDLGALPLDGAPAAIGVSLATLGNHALLDLELSALESEGLASIMASPRLITTNQHAAIIESGEDIPYQESTVSGATSVSFKKAVLRLKVTPHLIQAGKLSLSLVVNQDSDSGRRVQGVPILLTKSLVTRVLMHDGQTLVLGGIDKKDKNHATVSVPWLGSLPVIGGLFRRTATHIRQEVLLIFITPKIIV